MTIGHNLRLRLFLEGVEVPVISATVNVAPNSPSTASIQVIATDKVLELHPRTVVHLFFYDFVDAASPLSTDYNPNDPATQPLPPSLADYSDSAYKLLFMGELQTFSFQKDSGNRAMVLQCVDFSNYWDTTYQYNFKGSLLGGRRHAAFIGANANFFTSPLGHGVGTIAALLNGRSVNFPNLKGLLAGIVRMLEAIGGSYYGTTTFKGANDFTSIAELRLKILQQICAAEKDNSTAKLFARKAFNMWMNRQVGGLGKLVTFRGLTQMLQKFIFHDIYPCPAPKYYPGESGLKKKKAWAVSVAKDPATRAFVQKLHRMDKLFKSEKTNITGAYDNGVSKYWIDRIEADHRQLGRLMSGVGVPKIFVSGMAEVRKNYNAIASAVFKGADEGFGGVSAKKLGKASPNRTAENRCNDALDAIAVMLGKKIKHSGIVTYDKLPRVNNQVLRPDIWFVPAPRCNVLFPELYSNFAWSRNFYREVTRLELQTTHEILGDDALFNGRYYAPNVADMRKGLKLSSRRFNGLILQHELFTGIIPMYEKISEANLFAMRSRKVKYKGAKVGYAQRAVNFQYFKHRFASRQMTAHGRFNPWFVPGFPAVLIDRPMDNDKLLISGLPLNDQLAQLGIYGPYQIEWTRAMVLAQIIPTQFCGSCVQMSHNLNQQGGNTQYAFQQARVHRESTEYLGVDKAVVSKKVGTATRRTVVAAIPSEAPKVKKRGPRGGLITKVEDVSGQYGGKFVQLYNGKVKVKVGAADNINAVFKTSTNQSESPKSGSNYFKAYRISEQFTKRVREKIDLPIEEAIRPPWIWDGWSNLKIGETYMDFFGINSITDVDGFTSKEALETLEGADTYFALMETKEGKDQTKKGEQSTDKNDQDTEYETSTKQKISAATILAIEKERTIENAIDYLVRVYSFIKFHNLDVGEFLKNYTWRPIATLPEIMGSSDLIIEETSTGKYEATRGKEGFHSRAFSDESDLFGLVDKKVKKVLGLTKEKTHAAAKRLDVRAIRREAVREYVAELTDSRGLLG